MKYTSPEGKCTVHGTIGVDLHHIKSRAAGGSDASWNLIPISHALHVLWHQKGTSYMAQKHPQIHGWLTHNGWIFDSFLKRWTR